jgi:hypothetical protein
VPSAPRTCSCRRAAATPRSGGRRQQVLCTTPAAAAAAAAAAMPPPVLGARPGICRRAAASRWAPTRRRPCASGTR